MSLSNDAPLSVRLAWIAAAWTFVAIAWGPAAALVASADPSAEAFAIAIAMCVATFTPWALSTPALFRLCRRYPLGEGRDAFSVMALLASGMLVVPALTMVVPLVQQLGAALLPSLIGEPQSLPALVRRILVTSLFAIPTYVAVIAVGQTLVWAGRARDQETRSARAELRALRAELNPHFLMNALGAIAQMAHVSADRAEAALSALADVLRSGLAPEGEFHTLADELGAVDEHLLLYRALDGSLDYRREVADGVWQWPVPARILIPLVENALTHGAPVQDGRRHLCMIVTRTADGLQVRIGNPAPPRPHPSNGLNSGLDQVRQRLSILYRDRARMTASRDGGWFDVVLELPGA